MATRPMVANTAVSESSSGTSAATTEPNTNSRINSVIGIAIRPILASIPVKTTSSSRWVLTLPSSST